MSGKVRIKDIAEQSGVSVGTVDRILHNRPNVSKMAREKVEAVLKKIDYQPNMYASALAYNKSYTFYCIIPKHESEAYWEEIEEGIAKACKMHRDFHIDVKILYYRRYDYETFRETFNKCIECNPSGVIVVPSVLEVTKEFTNKLHKYEIPFVLLDSYMAELEPLSFVGQDSKSSGYFAAKILMLIASKEKEIMLMKQMKDGRLASKQQENREIGFKDYMKTHFPHIKIWELDLPLDEDKNEYDGILTDFFNRHPAVHHCITLCSKAHIVGDFFLRNKKKDMQIMGYDMVEKNARCLRQGSISFIIAQHAFMQGFYCVDTLFKYIVLQKDVEPINYMPIELLTKENVDFYRRTQL